MHDGVGVGVGIGVPHLKCCKFLIVLQDEVDHRKIKLFLFNVPSTRCAF
jgi:hypothetical protein